MASRVINSGDSSVNNKLQSYVPNSRTINGKQLDQDIVLEPADIGASEDFIITITKADDGSYVSDKTFEEIDTAYNTGKNLICEAHYQQISFSENAGDSYIFSSVLVLSSTMQGKKVKGLVEIVILQNDHVRVSVDTILSEDIPDLDVETKAKFRSNIDAGIEDFIITITSTDGENFTCDKTSAKINAAYEAGKNLLCVAEGGQGYLTIANDNIYEFYFNNVTDAIATTRASAPRILYLINIEINCNTEPPIVSYNEDIILGNKSVGMPDYIKAQFRNTIGAGTSDFSGSYNDLTDTPTIAQSDWTENETTAASYVKNRPGGYDIEISNTVFDGTIPESTEETAETRKQSEYTTSGELTTENLLIEGATATIVWNGTTYTDVVKLAREGSVDITYVGDIDLISFPFLFMTAALPGPGIKSARAASEDQTGNNTYAYICNMPSEPESPISVTITQSGNVPVKIAAKYLDLTAIESAIQEMGDHVDGLQTNVTNALNGASSALNAANNAQTTADAAIPNPSEKQTGQFLSYNGSAWVAKTLSEDNILLFPDIKISISDWIENTCSQASENEKIDFPYMAQISLADVASCDFALVNFAYGDLVSDIFSTSAYTVDGGVIIFANSIPTKETTLDSIVVMKVKIAANAVLFSSPSEFTLTADSKTWDGTLQTSTDGITWSDLSTSVAVPSHNGCIYVRGMGNTRLGVNRANASTNPKVFNLSGRDIEISGRISSLLDYRYQQVECSGECTKLWSAFNNMFSYNDSIVRADRLVLDIMNLSIGCYREMFRECNSLISAPQLPATTLAEYCYEGMFQSCDALMVAPQLPATTLARCCYQVMFYFCSSLTSAPELPANILDNYCYNSMFYGTAIKLLTSKTNEYQIPYRIPSSGRIASTATDAMVRMFSSNGTFTGTPEINTTYYMA